MPAVHLCSDHSLDSMLTTQEGKLALCAVHCDGKCIALKHHVTLVNLPFSVKDNEGKVLQWAGKLALQ